VPALTSPPSFGVRTSAEILAETGEAPPYQRRAVRPYAGLGPVTQQSGSSMRGESLSRRDNHRLKNAVVLAVFCSLRQPRLQALVRRKRPGKRHNTAVIRLARRRCDVMLAMLTSATPMTRSGRQNRPKSPNLTP
jgi:transposase